MLNDRNDLEIGGLGDWLPDESDYSTAVRVRKGLVSLAKIDFLAWIKGMDRMEGGFDWAGGMDSGVRRNDGWGFGMTVEGGRNGGWDDGFGGGLVVGVLGYRRIA